MGNILGLADTTNYVWIIPLAFSIHEFEEWNILKWYKKYYKNLPGSTNTSIHIHIVSLSILSFLLTFAAYITSGTFLFSLIVAFISSFILYNFIQHIIWTLQLKTYSPGLATASFCVLSVIYVNIQLIQNDRIILLFYLTLIFFIPSLIGTIKVKGEMTKEILRVHYFFIKMEKVLAGILTKYRT
jgi:hypothetical protein